MQRERPGKEQCVESNVLASLGEEGSDPYCFVSLKSQ